MCSKSRKCSRPRYHAGKCNSERTCRLFWEKLPKFDTKRSREADDQQARREADITTRESQITLAECEVAAKKSALQEYANQAEERAEKASEYCLILYESKPVFST